jgi:hypothetical protein
MTFEEIQKTIEGMLAVQKELQEGQLRLQERQLQLQDSQEQERETIKIMVEEMTRLIELSNRYDRRIERQHLAVSFQFSAFE